MKNLLIFFLFNVTVFSADINQDINLTKDKSEATILLENLEKNPKEIKIELKKKDS